MCFEKASTGGVGAEGGEAATRSGDDPADTIEEGTVIRDGQFGEKEVEEAASWDLSDDTTVKVGADFVNFDSADTDPGSTEADLEPNNSPIVADHVAVDS